MRISLCNEVIREKPFAEQCAFAVALGYDGLEVAPFTLGEAPHRLSAAERGEVRNIAEDAGLRITGLHWLLVTPEGLSITSEDGAVRRKTLDVLLALVDLCADLGGSVMVHGSPKQRDVTGLDPEEAFRRVVDLMGPIAEAAESAGVTYCFEPLARNETTFVNTVEDAVRLADAVGNPHFRTMIDTSAAAQTEAEPVAGLIRRWVPTGKIGHVQVNDRNRRGPGEGSDEFAPILRALRDTGYDRVVAVEPFVYAPDGAAVAARAIGYLRGLLEA
ncbi:sugar phosphate isomerase/epimerase family protein [Microbaculum marinum]|uniref:Sugar phosphate isomerase/epimerase family protein n=1 Tax=Microbaculum marinum TaxID=1764581 RepID=A0AAW9RL87_9HYPH